MMDAALQGSTKWAAIQRGAHAYGFTVAASKKEAILVDFRAAIDKAIAGGMTIADFRTDFDATVARFGWNRDGWRTHVPYDAKARATSVAFGRQLPATLLAEWRYEGAKAWERMTPGDWRSAGRPEKVPTDIDSRVSLGARSLRNIDVEFGDPDRAELRRRIATAIGADRAALPLPNGDTMLIDAAALSVHMALDGSHYMPFLPELLAKPFEVWLAFERHKGTGKIVLRKRLIKAVDDGDRSGLALAAQSVGGVLEAATFVPVDQLDHLQRQRVGMLLWGRR
jgi:hypothetical protein